MRFNTRLDDFPFRRLVSVLIDFSTEINKVKFKNILKNCLLTAATTLVLATSAQAVMASTTHAPLEGRDINGHAVAASSAGAVFLYDEEANLTWLRDANYAKTSGYDADGKMKWIDANAWVATLNNQQIGGVNNWRLPTTSLSDASCNGANYYCTGSEMGHLYYSVLGNPAHSPANYGDFQNLTGLYWSGTTDAANSNKAWFFTFTFGQQGVFVKSDPSFHAMAVRSGDISPAPEPETYAMLLAGLGLIGAIARRRKGQQG